MHSVLALLVALLVTAPVALAQAGVQLTDWRTYSSFRSVRAADVDVRGRLWCATAGGVFVHDPATGENLEYRNVGALLNLDVTSIRCDRDRGRTYIGTLDGSLSIVTDDGVWRNVSDIRRASQYPRRRINDMLVHDATLYLATDFGIVVYDLERDIFIETVDRIGTMQEKTPVRAIALAQDSLWAATDSGAAVAPLGTPTLRLPSLWSTYGTAQGLASNVVTAVRSSGGRVAVAVGATVYERSGNGFAPLFTTPEPILTLTWTGDGVLACGISGIRGIDGSTPIVWPAELSGHTALSRNGTPILVGFIRDRGIAIADPDGTVTPVVVNAPSIAQYMHVDVDASSRVWVASYSEASRTGQGASMFDGTTWTNLTPTDYPALPFRNAYRMSALPDGRVVVGTWGNGAFIATAGDEPLSFTRVDRSTAPVSGISSDSNFVLLGDAMTDRAGATWLVNEQGSDRLLVRVDRNGAWNFYRNCFNPTDNIYRSMAIDNAGTKWLGGAQGGGLYAFNERSTPDDPSDDICMAIRATSTNLPDNVVSSVVTDRNGAVWIGTAKGLAVMATPSSLTNTTVPFIRRVTTISATAINDIAVDALNYKWIATQSGVFVLNEDGTEVLRTITTSNSPLLSNDVRSVALDDRTGTVWFAMAEGLSAAATQSIEPLPSYDLSVYPQPYRPTQGGQLVVDGLAPDSDVRIMTPNGTFVAAIQTRGRQALWDGRDIHGQIVPPGVYVVQGRSTSQKESAVGKIAVTR